MLPLLQGRSLQAVLGDGCGALAAAAQGDQEARQPVYHWYTDFRGKRMGVDASEWLHMIPLHHREVVVYM